MRKIRTGDEVLVTTGRNKGQRGKVRVNLMDRDRVVIEGVNIVKKHIKRGRARQAGIVEVEAPWSAPPADNRRASGSGRMRPARTSAIARTATRRSRVRPRRR